MKRFSQNIIRRFALFAGAAALVTACNKDLPDATPIARPTPTGQSIATLINTDPEFSTLRAAVTRAGASLSTTLADSTGTFTVFAPTNAAFQASGISTAVINALRPGQVDTLLRYHIIGGQNYTPTALAETFPNLQAPSLFVLAPPSATLPPGLRMSLFPSRRGNNIFVNNIPVVSANISASNGTVYKVPFVVAPPTQFLWDRIDNDADFTFLKAAIQRADSGTAAASTLQAALQNPAASLTVFAPSNAAFQALLTGQITMALMAQGMDQANAAGTAAALAANPAVFSNTALFPVLTAQVVKAVVVYHLLGKRAFSINLPATATNVPTLLNSAVATHPGVTLQATLTPMGVTAATVKGLANPAPANIQINPTPSPGGTSDQHYINGVLHKIDQVLRPQ